MATTALATELTDAHRAAQLAVRAGSLRNLLALWRVVDPANLSGTIDTFTHAAVLLAQAGDAESAGLAAQYYSLFRRAEGIAGAAPAMSIGARPAVDALAGSIRGAALSGIINARRAGKSLAVASDNGLVKVIGTVGKLILAGGRRTIITAVQHDRQALGFQRVTSGDPCSFCRMLAGRGPVYKSDASAGFEPHDSCGCTAETVYQHGGDRDRSAEFAKEYQAAQTWARGNGTLSSGTSNDSLNNYRRYLAAGGPTPGVSGGASDGSNPGGR